jgi:hypothetical protein
MGVQENRVCGPAFCNLSMWPNHTPRPAFFFRPHPFRFRPRHFGGIRAASTPGPCSARPAQTPVMASGNPWIQPPRACGYVTRKTEAPALPHFKTSPEAFPLDKTAASMRQVGRVGMSFWKLFCKRLIGWGYFFFLQKLIPVIACSRRPALAGRVLTLPSPECVRTGGRVMGQCTIG